MMGPPRSVGDMCYLFHPCAGCRPPDQLLLQVAYKTYHRSLYITRAETPYARATPTRDGLLTVARLVNWLNAGVQTLGDLYQDTALTPFEELMEAYEISPGQFILYYLILATLRGHWGDMNAEQPMHHTI